MSYSSFGPLRSVYGFEGPSYDKGGAVYNVKHPDFGAVGDGTTDDRSAIQSAIDAANTAGGGIVVIPPSANPYRCATGLNAKADVTVICEGEIDAESSPAVTVAVDDLRWYGGRVTGNATTDTQVGFSIASGDYCIIEGVTISGFLNKGINLSGTSAYNRIMNNTVTGATGTTGVGISEFGASVKNNYFDGNQCTSNRIGMSHNGTFYTRSSNNNCSSNNAGGIFLDGITSEAGDGPKYGVYANNIANSNGSSSYGGFFYGNGAEGNVIIGLSANGNTGAGIRSAGGTGYKGTRNIFVNCYVTENSANGINLSNADYETLIGCVSYNNTGRGIYMFSSNHGLLVGCRAISNSMEGIYFQAGNGHVVGCYSASNTYGYRFEFGGDSSSGNRVYDSIATGNSTSNVTDSLSTVFRNVVGIVTENNGTATLVNGNTSVTVSHGLGKTPSIQDIWVTPIEAWGSATQFYINTPTSTQFTINVDANPGQDVDFAWMARIV